MDELLQVRIGDVVLVTLQENAVAARYRVRGVRKDRLFLHELWCEEARL